MTEPAFVRSPDVLFRSVAGELLVTAPGREAVDRLSPSAVAVWSLLREPRTLSAIVEQLMETFHAPRAKIAGDVEVLLGDLVQRGLVSEVQHP
jgi:Coenzyme PQQ synthesis protein D (PqqD)